MHALVRESDAALFKEGFSSVGKCIEGFAAFDFEGEFFRYPEDKDRSPWPQPVGDINLQRIRDAVSDAAVRLDCYYLEMNSMLERRAEMASHTEVREP